MSRPFIIRLLEATELGKIPWVLFKAEDRHHDRSFPAGEYYKWQDSGTLILLRIKTERVGWFRSRKYLSHLCMQWRDMYSSQESHEAELERTALTSALLEAIDRSIFTAGVNTQKKIHDKMTDKVDQSLQKIQEIALVEAVKGI